MFPAVGQGALGLECRADDAATRGVLAAIDHADTHSAVLAERGLLRGLGGGCHVPIGARTSLQDGTLTLCGTVLSPDGRCRIDAEIAGPVADAEALGENLARQLRAQGAAELLEM